MNIQDKYTQLRQDLQNMHKIAIAYSSGVDSTLLLKVAIDVLGKDNVLALTAVAPSFTQKEREETVAFCKEQGIKHIQVPFDVFKVEGFMHNPKNRCYLCKKELFTCLIKEAARQGFTTIVEGSNMDDLQDYRPGLVAIKELGVISPLRNAGLSKQEIRMLSKELGLYTASKPSFACLASRFVYGEHITKEKLSMVEQAEDYLTRQGFIQKRVRIHDKMARIEILEEDMERFMASRKDIYEALKAIGFTYISLDLQGYRTGSMNETLTKEELAYGTSIF